MQEYFCLLFIFRIYTKHPKLVKYFGKTFLDMGAIPINSTFDSFSDFGGFINLLAKETFEKSSEAGKVKKLTKITNETQKTQSAKT